MSSISDYSDKEKVLRLKRKVVNQNCIIKKHKLKLIENRKAVISAKNECEKILNKYQEEKNK